jgi:hypothetical protein
MRGGLRMDRGAGVAPMTGLRLALAAAALLTVTVLAACAPHARAAVPRRPPQDGQHRELAACDDVAERAPDPGAAYDACLASRGL